MERTLHPIFDETIRREFLPECNDGRHHYVKQLWVRDGVEVWGIDHVAEARGVEAERLFEHELDEWRKAGRVGLCPLPRHVHPETVVARRSGGVGDPGDLAVHYGP